MRVCLRTFDASYSRRLYATAVRNVTRRKGPDARRMLPRRLVAAFAEDVPQAPVPATQEERASAARSQAAIAAEHANPGHDAIVVPTAEAVRMAC